MKLPPDRKAHWLRPNDGTRTPQTIVALACEPAPEEVPHTAGAARNVLGFGVACMSRLERGKCSRKEWFEFVDAAAFWTWLELQFRDRRAVWVVSARLFRDLCLLGFPELLEQRIYALAGGSENLTSKQRRDVKNDFQGFSCLADPPTIIPARRLGRSVTMVDLRNYFPSDEKALGEKIGAPLLERPGDSAGFAEWQAYTSRRCRIAQESLAALVETWQREDLGVWQFTAAGLAMRAYRHRFMPKKAILMDAHEPATELGREALAGGEARCFYIGDIVARGERRALVPWEPDDDGPRQREGPVYVVDVTSFYGAMMKGNLFPCELAAFKPDGDVEDLQTWRKRLCLVARVEVESAEQTYPYAHHSDDERTRYWAVGRFWTTLCGPELLRALDAGHVRQVGPIAAYLPGRLFDRYVDYMWQKRSESEGADREMYKLLLVSLPGKFGQKSPTWQETGEESHEQKWGPLIRGHAQRGGVERYRVFAGYVQRADEPTETQNSFPLIEAYVNSYGRAWMANVRARVGEQHVIYQHTDSLHLTAQGYRNLRKLGLVRPGELGFFRLVDRYERATYRGISDYTLDGRNVVAGLPCDAEPMPNGELEVTTWEGAAGVINRGPDLSVTSYRELRRLGELHPRGRLTASGRVLPAEVRDGVLLLTGAADNPRLRRPRGKRKR